MTDLIPVEANPHLARDPASKAILNTDRAGYRSFMNQKTRRANREQELQSQLNTLKSELDEIRLVLQLVLAKGNN